jgi:hypothetical protein
LARQRRLSRPRTLSAIHDGPGPNELQSKAGYIDARPFTASSTKISCDARPDHTLGQDARSLYPGQGSLRAEGKPNLDRCFAGEEVTFAEWFATPRGRKYRAITFSPLRPDSQRVEAALLIARYLTDHMRASEALREAQRELAHVNRVTTMGQLAASIAHEVNQPVAAACNFSLAGEKALFLPRRLEEAPRACFVSRTSRDRDTMGSGGYHVLIVRPPEKRCRECPVLAVRPEGRQAEHRLMQPEAPELKQAEFDDRCRQAARKPAGHQQRPSLPSFSPH